MSLSAIAAAAIAAVHPFTCFSNETFTNEFLLRSNLSSTCAYNWVYSFIEAYTPQVSAKKPYRVLFEDGYVQSVDATWLDVNLKQRTNIAMVSVPLY